MRCLLLTCLLALSACTPPSDPSILPSLSPEQTRQPAEPAATYHGALIDTNGQPSGVIALIVGAQNARGLVCSAQERLWQTLSGWLVTSQREGDLWQLSNPAGDIVQMQPSAEGYEGRLRARSGEMYTFRARQLVDAQAIQEGAQEGVYWRDFTLPYLEGTVRLSLLVELASSQPDQTVLCGFLAQGERIISRVGLTGVWLGGFSVFRLLDLPSQPRLELLGALGQVDSIAPRRLD